MHPASMESIDYDTHINIVTNGNAVFRTNTINTHFHRSVKRMPDVQSGDTEKQGFLLYDDA